MMKFGDYQPIIFADQKIEHTSVSYDYSDIKEYNCADTTRAADAGAKQRVLSLRIIFEDGQSIDGDESLSGDGDSSDRVQEYKKILHLIKVKTGLNPAPIKITTNNIFLAMFKPHEKRAVNILWCAALSLIAFVIFRFGQPLTGARFAPLVFLIFFGAAFNAATKFVHSIAPGKDLKYLKK